MNLGIESETLEFKKSTGEIEKAVDNIASMLNKHGHGTLFFGVAPDGNVTGQQISAPRYIRKSGRKFWMGRPSSEWIFPEAKSLTPVMEDTINGYSTEQRK